MGFDLNIIINTGIDEKTGLPFVWEKNFEKSEYIPTVYQIPEKYRKYISQRGYHFHNYIYNFDDNTYQCDVEIFLNFYPEWNEEISEDADNWTKEDHDGFKECLEWLSSNAGIFGIRWSY